MPSLHHIIYMSHAQWPMSDEELVTLLQQARQHNDQAGITGVLVYGDRQFLQVMEGEANALTQLYNRITRDPRHERIIKMADKPVAQRSFADWSMAFRALPAEQFAHLAGYVTPEQVNLRVGGLSAADALLLEMAKRFVLSPRDL